MTRKALMLALGALVAAPIAAKSGGDAKPNAKGEAELARLVSGRIRGAPERCITTSPASSFGNARIVEGTAIVYDEGRTLYVNRPRGNLDTLGEDDTLVSDMWGSQLCSLDRVHTVEPGSRFPHSFMTLGDFVPYTRPRKD